MDYVIGYMYFYMRFIRQTYKTDSIIEVKYFVLETK